MGENELQQLIERWEASAGTLSPEELCATNPAMLPLLQKAIEQLKLADQALKSLHRRKPKKD